MFRQLKSGLTLTIILSFVLLFIFYYKLILSINSVYFVDSGDGIQSYFGVYYHVVHDSTLLHFKGMNYPYGESVFFSVNPPLIGICLYALNQVFDISNYIIGVFNSSILLSIVLSAIFIYLILCRFISNKWLRVLSAVFIAFISPQIIRIGGHYALAYLFVIPGNIWLLLKYYEKPSNLNIAIISIYTFVISLLHLYFFAFAGLIWITFHLYIVFTNDKINIKLIFKHFIHFLFQIALPYALLIFIINSSNIVNDRTNTPWGLLHFNTNLTGIFFPFDKFYTPVANLFINPSYVEWEGKQFFGIVVSIGFIYILLKILTSIFSFKKNEILNPFHNLLISYFAWLSFISLIVSFAYPLNTKFGETILDNINFFKQFRGIARFAWISYYSASIVVLYLILTKVNNRWFSLICLFILFVDAYTPNNKIQDQYNNKIKELNNELNQENTWISKIEKSNYQTIITLPFYTNGSENIYDQRGSWAMRYGMIVSMKTGIPLYNIHLSRTSISQTFNNFTLLQEPYRSPHILHNFSSSKKVLIISFDNEINENEINFLNGCKKIDSTLNYNVYEIDTEKLKDRTNNLYQKNEKLIKEKSYQNIEEANNVFYNTFESNNNLYSYHSNGSANHPIQHYHTFFEDVIPYVIPGEYVVSFWVGNFNKDLVPRTTYNITLYDNIGRIYENRETILGNEVKIIDKNWALIESRIKINNADDKVKITVWNKELKKDSSIIDRLMIRPVGVNVYDYESDSVLMMNNRIYLKM